MEQCCSLAHCQTVMVSWDVWMLLETHIYLAMTSQDVYWERCIIRSWNWGMQSIYGWNINYPWNSWFCLFVRRIYQLSSAMKHFQLQDFFQDSCKLKQKTSSDITENKLRLYSLVFCADPKPTTRDTCASSESGVWFSRRSRVFFLPLSRPCFSIAAFCLPTLPTTHTQAQNLAHIGSQSNRILRLHSFCPWQVVLLSSFQDDHKHPLESFCLAPLQVVVFCFFCTRGDDNFHGLGLENLFICRFSVSWLLLNT